MQALLNTAVDAARRAGETAVRAMKRLDELEVREKARNEYVTQVDHAAEQVIMALDGKRPPRIINPEVWPRYAERFERAFGFAPA